MYEWVEHANSTQKGTRQELNLQPCCEATVQTTVLPCCPKANHSAQKDCDVRPVRGMHI